MRRAKLSSASPIRLFLAVVAIPLAGAVAACSQSEAPTDANEASTPLVELTLPVAASPSQAVDIAERELPTESAVDIFAPPAPKEIAAVQEIDLLAEEALYHDDKDLRDFIAEAQRLTEEGRPGEAVTELRHALFDDGSATSWARLGDGYVRAGDDVHAQRVFAEALRQDPRLIDVRKASLRAALRVGKLGEAKTHADALIRFGPDDVSARYLAGLAYMKNSMWKESVAEMEHVTATEPTNIYAHNNAGFSALQVGDYETALLHLEPIAGLASARAYMLNNLGVAYERSDRRAEASAAFTRAVELRPGYVNGTINQRRVEATLDDGEREIAAEVLSALRTPIDAGIQDKVAAKMEPTADTNFDSAADERESEANRIDD